MVARCGSITAAAKQMYVSQSAMSQAISQLEKELGIKLFESSGRNIALSSVGKKILLSAQMIIDECNLIKHECELQQNGKMSVSLSAPALPTQVGRLVRGFYAEHPGIGVMQQPTIGSEPEIMIGVTLDENFSEKRVRIITEEIGLVVPTNHKLYGCGSIKLKELSPYPIISMSSKNDMRSLEDHFCGMAGFSPTREREMFTLSELLELVYAEVGVAFFPFKLWGIETISPERIVRITSPKCYRYIYVEQRTFPSSNETAVKTFFDYVVTAFREY
jgi:DNA-binding transcriptional LysR family regulator